MIWFMIYNFAWSSDGSNLCLPQEKVLFSCDTEGGKSIHLCAGEMDDWYTYIQYRFGDSPQNGLFFPVDKKNSLQKFHYHDSQISFVHDELEYIITPVIQVQSNMPFGGVRISTKGDHSTEILRIPCSSYPQGQLSSLKDKVGPNATQQIFTNRLRGFVDLELNEQEWGPIPIYESAWSSKRSRDTLSFASRSTIQRKYAFRYVGQSGVFFDEVRFVGWKISKPKAGEKKAEEMVFFEETEIAIPFSFRENPTTEDIFWIRKTDLHPLFLKRRGQVLTLEPWLCCNTISFYVTSDLKRKRGEITVKEIQQNVMQLVWYQADKQVEKAITLDPTDVQEVGYEIVYLNYFDIENERVQILNHSVPNGLWLPIKSTLGYQHVSLEKFLAQKQDALFPEIYDNVHLYTQPNYQPNNLLYTLRNDSYMHLQPTGNFTKGWFEVTVEEYTGSHSCGGDGESTGRIWKGWISTLLPNGEPTVWFYTRGC